MYYFTTKMAYILAESLICKLRYIFISYMLPRLKLLYTLLAAPQSSVSTTASKIRDGGKITPASMQYPTIADLLDWRESSVLMDRKTESLSDSSDSRQKVIVEKQSG